MTEAEHVEALVVKACKDLTEFCNCVLVIVSYGNGDEAVVINRGSGPTSHVAGLALQVLYEAQRAWDQSKTD